MHAHKHTRRHTQAQQQQQLYYGRFQRVRQLSVGLFGQKHIHHWFDSRVGRKTTLVLMQNKNNQPTTWSVMHKLMVVSWFVCCCSYFTISFLRRWQLPPRVELDTRGRWATRSLWELQFDGECGLFFFAAESPPVSRHCPSWRTGRLHETAQVPGAKSHPSEAYAIAGVSLELCNYFI